MFLGWANERDTKRLFCVHAAQTGKHLLRPQNVSVKNQKQFLCLGNKFCVRNKCCAHGQTGKHLSPQQCVRNIVSSFGTTFSARAVAFKWLLLTSCVHLRVDLSLCASSACDCNLRPLALPFGQGLTVNVLLLVFSVSKYFFNLFRNFGENKNKM